MNNGLVYKISHGILRYKTPQIFKPIIINMCITSSKKHDYIKTMILFCLFSVSCFSTFAQKEKMGGFNVQMQHNIGASFMEFDGLNSRVAKFPQYNEVDGHAGTLQLGLIKEKRGLISIISLVAGTDRNGDRDKKSSVIRFLGVSADAGYDFIKNDGLMLFPFVGIGYEKYQARFFQDNSNRSFDGLLETPNQTDFGPAQFKNAFLTYRAGAGFSFKPKRFPTRSIGLQAGYVGSFKSHDWKSQEKQTLGNAPEDRLSRWYVLITFGSTGCGPMMKHK